MHERSTLVILVALLGAMALYILARSNKKQPVPKKIPQYSPSHPSKPHKRTSQPRKRLATPSISTTRPTTQASSTSLQQQFERLRRRVLDPTSGQIFRKKLLPAATVQKVLGISKPLQAIFLQGIPRSHRYDAIQFVLKDNPTASQYILGLQIWFGKPQATQTRWANQQRSYPNVRLHTRAIAGLRSFAAHRGTIYYLNVQTRTSVFSLSCHQKYCSKGKYLKHIARTVVARLP